MANHPINRRQKCLSLFCDACGEMKQCCAVDMGAAKAWDLIFLATEPARLLPLKKGKIKKESLNGGRGLLKDVIQD